MGRVGINWVTDRLPTEADADSDGDVHVADRGYSQWNNVKKHEKWCVTYYWEPREEPQERDVSPTSEERDLQAFHEWMRTEAESRMRGLPLHTLDSVRYLLRKAWAIAALNARRKQQADAEKPQPQIIWPQDDSVEVLWRCNNKRRIITIFRTVHEYGHTLDAIADDGTAWCLIAGNESWEQLPELPMKEGA